MTNESAGRSNLAKCFVTKELMRWPGIEHIYGATLRSTPVFGSTEDGEKRWDDLHTRVIEHVSNQNLMISLSLVTLSESKN